MHGKSVYGPGIESSERNGWGQWHRADHDGIGMDPRILDSGGRGGHWGLPGMQERASAIQGHLEIWSDLTRGTEIELKVPGSVAYAEVKAKLWKP